MVKFVHSADWQLGMTRHFLSDEAQSRFAAARLDVIERIGALAVEEGCEFVVVAGDVFESNQVRRQVLRRALEKMAKAPQVRFFLLPGNHDPLDASSIYRSPTFKQQQPDNVEVLETSEPVQAAAGVELVPAPWPNKHPTFDLVGAACEQLEPTDGVRIVVGHGAVDSMSPSRDDPRLIAVRALEDRIRSGLIHYVALGDRHSTTDVGDSGRVWYAGAPEPTAFNETDPAYALVVDLAGTSVDVRRERVGKWRFVRPDDTGPDDKGDTGKWDLSSDEDIDALEEWLEGLDHKDRTVVRMALVGQISIRQKARLDDLWEQYTDLLAALETWERHTDLAVIPDDADVNHLGLSGFAGEALSDLSRMAEDAEDRDRAVAARDALALLYRLAGPRQ